MRPLLSTRSAIRDGGGLLAGQVFMNMGVINEEQLKIFWSFRQSKGPPFCCLAGRPLPFLRV